MADYKELLRRAVEALPENNGAARRAVYEKARAALVGQLRAINPPLAARDITAHRLQLEDCIRQVEQEASEAVIAGLGSSKEEAPPPPPVYFEPPAKKAPTSVARPVAKPVASAAKEPPKPLPPGGSIEEIIAAANAEPEPAPVEAKRSVVRPEGKPMGKPVPKLVPSATARPQITAPTRAAAPPPTQPMFEEPEFEEEVPAPPPARSSGKPSGRPLPSIVARAEAAKSRTSSAAFGAPIGGATRGPELTPRRELTAQSPRLEPAARGGQATARQIAEPVALFNQQPVPAAMSAVREVDVEQRQALDPQDSIDRAIATLDREARGELDDEPEYNGALHDLPEVEDEEAVEPQRKNGFANGMLRADAPTVPLNNRNNGKPAKPSAFAKNARQGGSRREAEQAFPKAREEGERRGMGAVTVFLIVFVVLLLGAGGAGFWAWREGFINLDQMFGRAVPTEQQAETDSATPGRTSETPVTGPGNTDTPVEVEKPVGELTPDDRLGSDTPAVAETQALPLVPAPAEQRLGTDTPATDSAEAEVAKLDPANTLGGQSLLLEASENGKTGAVPFSGSIDWTKGTDEMGLPTLIGKASIPARNLSVDVLIRKNSDSSLPASHLMEVNFKVNDSFIGGSIAGLPGVLLKNEELVQGTPLVGASARVVGNSFLFALSASPEDITANSNLLMSRKYMDLALIYATGKRAIITLEKDPAAVSLFNEVVGAWTTKAADAQ